MTHVFIRAAVLAMLLATTAQAGDVQSANAKATKESAVESPGLPVRKARVAQHTEIDLAVPALSGAQLAAMRPHYAELKPRVRSNAE
jgi:hypothetical protein